MADLTPPSSKQGTPLRPTGSTEPVSPTQALSVDSKPPHPLANSAGNTDEDAESTNSLEGEGEGEYDEEDMVGMSEDEVVPGTARRENVLEGEDMEVEGDEGREGEGEMEGEGEVESMGEGAGVGEIGGAGAAGGVGAGGAQSEGNDKGKAKAQVRRRGKGRAAEKKRAAGTTPAKVQRREADLYESEIIARWNAEIGDVCVDRPVTAQIQTVP